MKKTLIVALVCLNAALLLTLFMTAGTPTAHAQVSRGGNNYVAVTAQIETSSEILYVADLASRQLLAFRFDATNERLVPFKVRKLTNDFRRDDVE